MTAGGRAAEMAAFLDRHGLDGAAPAPLAGDASFRRYWRVAAGDGTAVLMDAPPDKEDTGRFVAVASYLRSVGYSAPEVLAMDPARGFLLLEDLGDEKLSALAGGTRAGSGHYELAVDLLADLHGRTPPPDTPPYDGALLAVEASLFVEWYLPAIDAAPAPAARAAFDDLWREALAPYAGVRDVLVLLDYHADNLMWLGHRQGLARLGLLDFQDAVAGHPAYDLVSLLEDARLDVDGGLAATMFARYVAATNRDPAAFGAAYATLGAQRNTKIIGIFSRLALRDGKPGYLAMIPRVWRHLERDLAHPALGGLRAWYGRHVPAARPAPEMPPARTGGRQRR